MTTDTARRPLVGARRFERLLETIVGVFAVPFTLQTSDAFLADWPTMHSALGVLVVALVLASVVGGFIAGLSRGDRQVRFLLAFLLYVLALAVWPLGVTGGIPTDPMPWLAAVAPVPLAYLVVVARRWPVPLLGGAVVAVVITAVLATVGRLEVAEASINGAFVFAITALLTVVVGGVRRTVTAADAAQQAALDRYADARFDHATEDERVRTDALVHDRVLTTFLSAAAARTGDDEELAARMARTALRVLSHVTGSTGSGPRVPLARTLAEAAAELAPVLRHVDLQLAGVDHVMLPGHVGEAMVEAMTQAMVNSVKHAGADATRTARIEAFGIDGVRIVVEDDGAGFDPALVSAERLGVRVSILERVQRIDGRASIDTAPGRGTRIVLMWGSDLEITPAEAARIEAASA